MMNDINGIVFAENLNRLLKINNVTPTELSKAINVTVNTVYRWKNGVYVPSNNNIKKICEFFNIPTDELIGNCFFRTDNIKCRDITLYKKIKDICESIPNHYHKTFLYALSAFVKYLNCTERT